MNHPHPLTDPIHDGAIELKLEQFAGPQAAAGSPGVGAELDRYNIAAVHQTVYEWNGYRYTNAWDAIAAAKRGLK